MKIRITLISVFLSLVLLLGSIFLYHKVKTKVDDNVDVITPASVLFPTHIYLSIMNDGKEIDNGLFIKYLLINHLSDEPILVVDYSQMGCNSCIQSMLNGLTEVFDSVEHNRNIVFVISESYRDDSEPIVGNSIYLPKDETLGFETERNRYPILFVYSHGIRHSFMPDPEAPDVYKLYLKTIRSRYGFN